MNMKMAGLDFCIAAFQRRLVNAHAVGKVRLEQIVISSRHFGDGLGQSRSVFVVQIHQRPFMPFCKHHYLKRPDCPPGTQRKERCVFKNHTFFFLRLQSGVIFQQMCASVLASVRLQLFKFQGWLLGKTGSRPDLTVRMGIRAPHHRPFVLEDLHIAVLRARSERASAMMIDGGEISRGCLDR